MSAEGDLEREIQDIVEELEIMISLNKTQSDLYIKFTHHASKALYGHRIPGLDIGGVQLDATTLMTKVKGRIDYLESLLKTASNAAKLVSACSGPVGYIINSRRNYRLKTCHNFGNNKTALFKLCNLSNYHWIR